MATLTAPGQTVLPGQFTRPARRAYIRVLPRDQAIQFGAEVLMRALNSMAFNPQSRTVDRDIGDDPRFRISVSVAVPLSLTGAPTRRQTLMDLAGRVARLARERGVSGPVGRALEAARLLSIAALDQDAAVSTTWTAWWILRRKPRFWPPAFMVRTPASHARRRRCGPWLSPNPRGGAHEPGQQG